MQTQSDAHTSASETIRVFARVRPLLPRERGYGEAVKLDGNQITVASEISTKVAQYRFDKILSPVTKQVGVFECVKPLIDDVLAGYNSTVCDAL